MIRILSTLSLTCCLLIKPTFAESPTDRGSVHLNDFVSQVADKGCLLSKNSTYNGLILEKGGELSLTLFDSKMSGVCDMGGRPTACATVNIDKEYLSKMYLNCPSAKLGNLYSAPNSLWLENTKMLQTLIGLYEIDSLREQNVNISESLSIQFPSEGLVITTPEGEKTVISKISDSVRTINAKSLYEVINSHSMRAEQIKWVGPNYELITDTGEVSGVVGATGLRIVDSVALEARIKRFNLVVQLESEGKRFEEVLESLILNFLDPEHDISTLQTEGFVMDPVFYLAEGI